MDVKIELGGDPENRKTETLVCTLKAAKAIVSMGGSFAVLRRLQDFDQEAYIYVVAAGLSKRPVDVEQIVYETGMPDLNDKLSEYVSLLSNGGRPLKKADPAAPQGDGSGNA
jgi:hypothetical protein